MAIGVKLLATTLIGLEERVAAAGVPPEELSTRGRNSLHAHPFQPRADGRKSGSRGSSDGTNEQFQDFDQAV